MRATNGALRLANATTNNGTIELGAGPRLDLGNNLINTSTSVIDVDINSSAANDYGRIVGNATNSNITLDGTLNITLLGGFEPNIGESFTIITGASVTGTFAAVNGTAIVAGRRFDVVYSAANVTLMLVTDP